MDKTNEAIFVGVMLVVALVIVVVNDWTKARAYRKAERMGRKPRALWENHRTSWSWVSTLVVFALILIGVAIAVPVVDLRSRTLIRLLALIACVVVLIASTSSSKFLPV